MPMANKTQYLMTYTKMCIEQEWKIPLEKRAVFPPESGNYMTITQHRHKHRWERHSGHSLTIPATFYIIPDSYLPATRRLIRRLNMGLYTSFITNDDSISELEWSRERLPKGLVVITWSQWNDVVYKLDTLFHSVPGGYGVERVIFDQLEYLWTSKNRTKSRSSMPIYNVVPAKFVWYVSNTFLKLFESIFECHFTTLDHMKYIGNYTSSKLYEDGILRKGIDLLISEYIDLYEFTGIEEDADEPVELVDDMVLQQIDTVDDFYLRMSHYTKAHIDNQLNRHNIHRHVQLFIMNNPGTDITRSLGEPYIHTKRNLSVYEGEVVSDGMFACGWIPALFQRTLFNFVYQDATDLPESGSDSASVSTSASESDGKKMYHCLNTGIFVNRWTDVLFFIVRRMTSAISRFNHVRFYTPMCDRLIRTVINRYLYTTDGIATLNQLYRHYKTFPTLDIAIDTMMKETTMLINYYKLIGRRMDDDVRISIAYNRQRTYRLIQNRTANSCPVCMDELFGPLYVSGCCQSIYHCSCIMATWETRYHNGDDIQCPCCRSNPIHNAETYFIPNYTDDELSTVSNTIPFLSGNGRVRSIPPNLHNQLAKILMHVNDKHRSGHNSTEPTRIIWVTSREVVDTINEDRLNFMFYCNQIVGGVVGRAEHQFDSTSGTANSEFTDQYTSFAIRVPYPVPIEIPDTHGTRDTGPDAPRSPNSYQTVLNSVEPLIPLSGSDVIDDDIQRCQMELPVVVRFIDANNGISGNVNNTRSAKEIHVYVISKYVTQQRTNTRRVKPIIQDCVNATKFHAIIQSCAISYHQVQLYTPHYGHAEHEKMEIYYLDHKRY
jgi:hypothetical protein